MCCHSINTLTIRFRMLKSVFEMNSIDDRIFVMFRVGSILRRLRMRENEKKLETWPERYKQQTQHLAYRLFLPALLPGLRLVSLLLVSFGPSTIVFIASFV